jgi:hypothetical protein
MEFVPDAEGVIEVPDDVDYAELLNHGFTPASRTDLRPVKLSYMKDKDAGLIHDAKLKADAVAKGEIAYGRKSPDVAPEAKEKKERPPIVRSKKS